MIFYSNLFCAFNKFSDLCKNFQGNAFTEDRGGR